MRRTKAESIGTVRERERERELYFNKTKRSTKTTNGITLIALVITVIVLLILAGITLVSLTGENGVLNKSKQAAYEYEWAQAREEIVLAINSAKMAQESQDGASFRSVIGEELSKVENNTYNPNKQEEINTAEEITGTNKGIYGYTIDLNSGNITKEERLNQEIADTPEPPDLQERDITFTYTPSGWTKGPVKAEIKVNIEIGNNTLQYSLTGEENSWKEYTTPLSISNNGQKIYVRLWNGVKESAVVTGTVGNIDTVPPLEFSAKAEATANSITVTGSTQDGAETATSGVSGNLKYYYSKDNGTSWEPTEGTTNTTYTFSGLTEDTPYQIKMKAVDQAGNEAATETVNTETSYIGYYADVDADGTVDGVIYADLAVGGSGTWGSNGWGNYSYGKETSGLKKYYVSSESYSGFGGKWTKPVLTEIEGSGEKDRFYVMALEDFNPGTYYCWYDAAYGKLDDPTSGSANDFGEGRENTETMIAKWNSKGYGAQDDNGTYKDMWGVIQKADNKGKTWDHVGSNPKGR